MELVGLVNLLAHLLHVEILLQRIEELCRSKAVQVFYHAVVIDDVELVGREEHGEEIVVLLFTRMVRIGFHPLLAHTRSGSGTVMTVSYIKCRNAFEYLGDTVDNGFVADYPHLVTHVVGRSKVVFGRLILDRSSYDVVYLLDIGVGEEHRLHVGALDVHMYHTVFLLLRAGQLVFLNLAVDIIHEIGSHGKTVLRFAVHRLGIDVVVLLVVLHEPAFLFPEFEVLNRLVIHLLVVLVGNRVEIYLGLDDVK